MSSDEHARPGRPGQSTVVLRDGVAVVTVAGEVDVNDVDQMREVLAKQVEARPDGLVLELAVGFFGSAGLAALIETDERAQREGIGFAIVAAVRTVRRPLEVTGLVDTLPVYGSVDEALRALRRSGSA